MLPEEEDLLQQLSGELGIPEFLEDLPMLDEGILDPGSVFSEVPTSMDTNDANFMTIDFGAFPPSPSDSDSSQIGDVKDGILSLNLSPGSNLSSGSNPNEVSPPVSPPAMGMPNIVSVSDLSNVKIPIPKIQKPSKFQ